MNYKMDKFHKDISCYNTTDDPNAIRLEKGQSWHVKQLSEKLYTDVVKNKPTILDKLYKYIKKYPNEPTFKNYLALVYNMRGNIEKAFEVNKRIVKEHPDYLYGKINLANEYIKKEKPEDAIVVLGVNLDLQKLYPHRDLFHIDEVITYYIAVVRYLFSVDESAAAEDLISQLEANFMNYHKLEALRNLRMEYTFKKSKGRFEEEEKLRRTVAVLDRRSDVQTESEPEFNFPEWIGKLYTSDIEISEEIISQILDLPKDKLEDDLIKVVQDAICRFDFFNEIEFEDGWNDDWASFCTHSLFLLAEIGSENSLTVLLEILRQDDDFTSFWFGDTFVEVISPVLYKVGKDNLSELLSFAKEPNISCFNKSIITHILVQIDLHESHRHQEIILWFKELFDFLMKNNEDPTIGDTDFLGLLIADLMHIESMELLPEIKKMYEMKAVGYWVCGSYGEVEKSILERKRIDHEYKDDSLICNSSILLYQKHKDKWYREEDSQFYDEDDSLDEDYVGQPILKEKKVGRNDPCPCGSGKKYKKCCINNPEFNSILN